MSEGLHWPERRFRATAPDLDVGGNESDRNVVPDA